ncbi:MAG: CCA tRNA nucleotidyltransferase, partial [Xanthobacteraceae bacterium]|nr:CCA tRNA nucleotidyltransferase [Xanthobacteraceae bacterium]
RVYRLGADRYLDRIMLAWARAGSDSVSKRWRELATLPRRWSAPEFPLKAADFLSRGLKEGPALGHVITLAEDAWLAAIFRCFFSVVVALAYPATPRFRHDHRL